MPALSERVLTGGSGRHRLPAPSGGSREQRRTKGRERGLDERWTGGLGHRAHLPPPPLPPLPVRSSVLQIPPPTSQSTAAGRSGSAVTAPAGGAAQCCRVTASPRQLLSPACPPVWLRATASVCLPPCRPVAYSIAIRSGVAAMTCLDRPCERHSSTHGYLPAFEQAWIIAPLHAPTHPCVFASVNAFHFANPFSQ